MVQRQVSSSWWREYLSLPSAPPLPDARGAPLFNAEHVAVDAFKLGLSDDPVHRVLFYGREGRILRLCQSAHFGRVHVTEHVRGKWRRRFDGESWVFLISHLTRRGWRVVPDLS